MFRATWQWPAADATARRDATTSKLNSRSRPPGGNPSSHTMGHVVRLNAKHALIGLVCGLILIAEAPNFRKELCGFVNSWCLIHTLFFGLRRRAQRFKAGLRPSIDHAKFLRPPKLKSSPLNSTSTSRFPVLAKASTPRISGFLSSARDLF